MAVIVASVANVLVALAKSAAAVLTGSASMTAEAAPDAEHPLGYGREAYVWSMFAAIGLFAAGAVVSVMRGIVELVSPGPGGDYLVACIVLAVSALLEGASFAQAYRSTRASARASRQQLVRHALATSDPTLRAVIAEDSGALIGLALGAAGVALREATGSAVYDSLGSVLIGLLLGAIGIVLIDRNRRFLIGQSVPPAVRRHTIEALLSYPEVERITLLRMEFIGADATYVVAGVDIVGDDSESSVAVRLRRLEARLKEISFVSEAVLTVSTSDAASITE